MVVATPEEGEGEEKAEKAEKADAETTLEEAALALVLALTTGTGWNTVMLEHGHEGVDGVQKPGAGGRGVVAYPFVSQTK